MDSTQEHQSSSNLTSLSWVPLVFDLFAQVRKFVARQQREGIYEMLEYESVLELLDARGEAAIVKKRQRVRFLQDNIIAFQDHAWGDGEIFADYRSSPGVVVDRYKDGDRWNVLISLRETKSTGDIEDFHIERKLRDSFRKHAEWWQIQMYHKTRRLKLSIIFPAARHCQRAVLVERNANRTKILESKNFAELPDRRQVLTWETDRPRRFEIYTIKWQW